MKPKAFRWIIDTSSLIYLQKAELLTPLRAASDIVVPLSVFREWNHKGLVQGPFLKSVTLMKSVKKMSADDEVIHWAKILKRYYVLSEDKKIFMKARVAGIAYYNSLRIPRVLMALGRIGPERAVLSFEVLTRFGYYGKQVIQWAKDELYHHIDRLEKERIWEKEFS